MAAYACLTKQTFFQNDYSIVPIRMEDRHLIMKWRNEQLYHLRQNKPLTTADQDTYFTHVVAPLFEKSRPDQILFSYLDKGKCIGYGGLVHVNWVDQHAEISFVMDTELEKDFFGFHWSVFLAMIEELAFSELHLHKIFTYAFDLRPNLYITLEQSGFTREAELKEHCYFEGEYKSVIIHSKINPQDGWSCRQALPDDAALLFRWANDDSVRVNAFNKEKIDWDSHLSWLNRKLADINCQIWIFSLYKKDVGQVRVEWTENHGLIDYSIDHACRGKGYGTRMIQWVQQNAHELPLIGKVKASNIASAKVFEKCGFVLFEEKEAAGERVLSYKYSKG